MIEHLIKPKRQAAPPGSGAPDDYDDFQLPEGMDPDHPLHDRFKEVARSVGLSQDDAQKLVDMYATHAQDASAKYQECQNQRISDWHNQARADPEIGGQKFDSSIALAQKAVDRFGGDKFAQALVDTGAASHPEVLRALYRIGKSLSEDGFVSPGAKRQKKSVAELLYPNMNP